jgi:hypothetical protein
MTPQSYYKFSILDRIRETNDELLKETRWLERFEATGETEAARHMLQRVGSLNVKLRSWKHN